MLRVEAVAINPDNSNPKALTVVIQSHIMAINLTALAGRCCNFTGWPVYSGELQRLWVSS